MLERICSRDTETSSVAAACSAASLLVFSGMSDRDAALAAKREAAVLISLTPGSQLAEHVEQIV